MPPLTTKFATFRSDLRYDVEYVRLLWQRRFGRRAGGEGSGEAPATFFGVTPPPTGTVVEVDGIRMLVGEQMSAYNACKLAAGRHTKHERALLARVLRDDDVVLELGGGIGMVAIACAKRLGSQNVVSYEANPDLEPLIRRNYELNGVAPRLEMAMVGPADATREFHLSERFSRSSAHAAEGTVRTVAVPVHDFSRVMADVRPTVLVVDIQGGEAEFFGYAPLSGVRLVLVEVHPFIIGRRGMRAVRQRMRNEGFREAEREGQSFVYVREVARRPATSAEARARSVEPAR